MIIWNVEAIRDLMTEHGLENANQLHAFAGLTVPTAYNVLNSARLERIETATLERLAVAFNCPPWDLLTYIPD